MPAADAPSKFVLNGPRIWVGWVVVLIAVIAVSALVERQKLLTGLLTEADILHRVASQRADQHDAHLTSLSALAVAGSGDRQDLMLEVAATILRFYPTIRAVDLVELKQSPGYISTRSDLPGQTVEAIRQAAQASDGQLVLLQSKEDKGAYLLVKRSPNSDAARFGLALQIDADALIERRGRLAEDKIAAAERSAIAEVRAKAASAATAAAAVLIQQKHDADADKALIDSTISGMDVRLN